MDNYELFKRNNGIEISREDFEAGVSYKNGKIEGHPALIIVVEELIGSVVAPYNKRTVERHLIQSHIAAAKKTVE
ncbi:hypothetical protein [Paenibacillus durus]|uniref:Uncharacterized protein n=1 Tax=Paenibacillus durus TaxID=44251 RepID=A0A089HGX7_PAEDU|nr:hypothetical protein [Paenibacillus durus]AIQ11221.1 hypothetical protein PDUR_03805 [Paenibacillus durus]